MFSTNEQKLEQMIDDPPAILDSAGRPLGFIDAEKLFPNGDLPNGGIRFRYRLPSENGVPGQVFEFTFRNPPQRKFSFGFRVSTTVK